MHQVLKVGNAIALYLITQTVKKKMLDKQINLIDSFFFLTIALLFSDGNEIRTHLQIYIYI